MPPVWYDEPNIAHRLGHPFVHPGGPSVVAEPAAARRQTVQQFQDQAFTAWSQLLSTVQGLHQQVLQQSQEEEQQSSDHHQQQQDLDLDLTGLAVPVLPRRRLTGPVLLMPEPDPAPPGMTPQQAAAAAVAAARAALPPENELLETLLVPAGCLQLHSWQESAAAEDPPGEVAASIQLPRAPAAAGARTAGAAAGATAAGVDADLLQRGSEVLVTLTVMDTSRRLASVQQEIQALGSNTLADLRDAIVCPTDKLAAGLGASNPAAYFYVDGCFYDDTRLAPVAECSQVVQQWARRLGLAGPKHLLQHFELPGAQPATPPQPQPQQEPSTEQQPEPSTEQQLEQQPQKQQQQQQEGRNSREMQHVRLSELVLQASNRPMVLYSHQGLCEHAVVVSDVRLLHAADANRRSAYPRTVLQQALGRRLHCGVCKRPGATALMLNHPETPEAVIVLCRLCCGLFSVEQHPDAKLIMLEAF